MGFRFRFWTIPVILLLLLASCKTQKGSVSPSGQVAEQISPQQDIQTWNIDLARVKYSDEMGRALSFSSRAVFSREGMNLSVMLLGIEWGSAYALSDEFAVILKMSRECYIGDNRLYTKYLGSITPADLSTALLNLIEHTKSDKPVTRTITHGQYELKIDISSWNLDASGYRLPQQISLGLFSSGRLSKKLELSIQSSTLNTPSVLKLNVPSNYEIHNL